MANSLTTAPKHIQLAVDLILLLEQNEVEAETVLAALDIVKQDYIKKRDVGGNPKSRIPAHTS